MVRCTAPDCKNTNRNGSYKFYSFPSNPHRRLIWAQNCKKENCVPTADNLLCNVHFEDSQFELGTTDGHKKLIRYAVPTKFSVPSVANVEKQPPKSFLTSQNSTEISPSVSKTEEVVLNVNNNNERLLQTKELGLHLEGKETMIQSAENAKITKLQHRPKPEIKEEPKLEHNYSKQTFHPSNTNPNFLKKDPEKPDHTLKQPFLCQKSTPQKYLCKICSFTTDFAILLLLHVERSHPNPQRNSDFNCSINLYTCLNCPYFETYSFLHWIKHEGVNCRLKRDQCLRKPLDIKMENAPKSSSCQSSQGQHSNGFRKPLDIKLESGPKSSSCQISQGQSSNCFKKPLDIKVESAPKSSSCQSSQGQRSNSFKKLVHVPVSEIVPYQDLYGNYWYECEHCDYITKQIWRLRKHVKNHKSEMSASSEMSACIKWFQCGQCEYKSRNIGNVRMHQIVLHFGKQ